MKHHPTVTLTSPSGEAVDIDEMLAPLIAEAWKADIVTMSCCQDAGELGDVLRHFPHLAIDAQYNAGYAYVDFTDEIQAAAFLNAVADAGPRDAFYVRMVHWTAPGAWRKTAGFSDWSTENDGNLSEPSDFELDMVKVKFPITDIPEIVERLRRHNRGEPPVLGAVDWSTVEVPDLDGDDA